jgi:hypothetical protein
VLFQRLGVIGIILILIYTRYKKIKPYGTIKSDLLELSGSLHARQLELFRLNFSEIILLPKANEAGRIQKFRPVYLLNISFIIFTKVVTIRLNTMADHMVQPSQTASIQGRNILYLDRCLFYETTTTMHCILRRKCTFDRGCICSLYINTHFKI